MATSHSVAPSLRKQYPKEYDAWKSMRKRCYDPGNPSYKYYGEKGISVCRRWRESFAAFLEDMGPAPTPNHTLERGLNYLGYVPGNVIWATPSEQQHNTSKCRWITFRGKRLLLEDWAKETGLSRSTIQSRLDKFGWTIREALTLPPYGRR